MKKVLSTILVLALAFTFVFAGSSFAFADDEVLLGTPKTVVFGHDVALENKLDIVGDPLILGPLAHIYDPSILKDPAGMTVDEVKAALAATEMGVKSQNALYNGKSVIKLYFSVDSEIVLDGVEVYRALSLDGDYGKTPIFETKNSSYINTKVAVGTRYFYKIRGFVEVDGTKYYTDFSKRAYRMVKANPTETTTKPTALYAAVQPQIVGGFTPVADGTITPELQSKFTKASADLIGVRYELVELVATQVVAGTNYKFLANASAVYPGAPTTPKYITVYEDLQGNCSILKIEDVETQLAGGFTPAVDGTMTAELKAIFDKAMADFTGVGYEPVKLVATQVVAGINYKFLTNATGVYPGAVTTQKYVTVYKDLQGNCSVLSVEDVE